jgi:hypothetical protein
MAKKKEIVVSEVKRKEQPTDNTPVKREKREYDTKIIPYTKEETLETITRPNCHLCQSKLRQEAEILFLKQRVPSYNAIVTFLKDRGEEVSWPGVRNHLVFHFKAQQKKEFLSEYAYDIEKWIAIQPDKATALKKRMAVLEREMMMIGSEGEDMPIIERRKNAETIKKLADTLLTYEEKLEQYEKALEPVTIIVNQLKIIISDEMEQVGTPETRKVLINVLERLQNKVGDIIVQEEG